MKSPFVVTPPGYRYLPSIRVMAGLGGGQVIGDSATIVNKAQRHLR
jgi:hypothetical protein